MRRQEEESNEDIALERAARDRWRKGDPAGFLETYTRETPSFDPGVSRRSGRHEAMENYYRPFSGKINVLRYEISNGLVHRHGDVAVGSYDLVSDALQGGGLVATSRHSPGSSVRPAVLPA